MIQPYGALLIGAIGGVISVLGFKYFTPFLSKINVYDPCGINSLHGIPGLFSGLCSVAVVLMANEETYGFNLYKLYQVMSPKVNTTAYWQIKENLSDIAPGIGRSREMQASYQSIYILITIAFALLTGSITGLLLRLKIFDPLEDKHMYLDDVFWEVPEVKEK
ncbi:Ammonium transporter Rh type B, partial [Stegodyphus mimosarum]